MGMDLYPGVPTPRYMDSHRVFDGSPEEIHTHIFETTALYGSVASARAARAEARGHGLFCPACMAFALKYRAQ